MRGDRGRAAGLRADRRAVSAPVGFMLVVAILVALLGVLQVAAVPTWNQAAEVEHSDRVQADLLALGDDVQAVAATGSARSRTVAVGLRYPTRPFLLNPPPATGSLETTDPGTVEFENARASGETGHFWNGSTRRYETRAVVYRPAYEEYGDAPRTRLESGVVANRFAGADLALSEQRLVRGDRVSLVALQGAVASSRPFSESVSVSAASAPTRRVSVTDDGDPIALTVPTAMSVDFWRDRLADQRTDAGGHVTAVEDAPGAAVRVVLEPGVTYDLEVASVTLDGTPADEPPAYLTDVEGAGAAVPQGGATRLAVEARDRFNAPVAGADVTAEVVSGPGSVAAVVPTTGEDGRAAFRYRAPADETGTAEVRVRFADAGAGTPTEARTVTYRVEVYAGAPADGGGGDGAGVGTGGASRWSPADASATLSDDGGTWTGLAGVSSLDLSAPRFTPLSGNQETVDADREYLRLTLALRAGDTTYLVDVTDHADGLRRTHGGGWANRRVVVYRQVGDARYAAVGAADLRTDRLEPWYGSGATLDLLAQPSYQGNHAGVNELRQFLRANDDVELHVVEMDGRVTLTAT